MSLLHNAVRGRLSACVSVSRTGTRTPSTPTPACRRAHRASRIAAADQQLTRAHVASCERALLIESTQSRRPCLPFDREPSPHRPAMAWSIALWVIAFAAQAALLGANMWGLVVLSDLEVRREERGRDWGIALARSPPHPPALSSLSSLPSSHFPGRHDEPARFGRVPQHLDGTSPRGPKALKHRIFCTESHPSHPPHFFLSQNNRNRSTASRPPWPPCSSCPGTGCPA